MREECREQRRDVGGGQRNGAIWDQMFAAMRTRFTITAMNCPPAAAVFDSMEWQNDPSFDERGIMQVMQPTSGDFKMPTWPVRVDGKPARLTASPRLGQHSAEVLHDWLGISAAEVATLRREGVL